MAEESGNITALASGDMAQNSEAPAPSEEAGDDSVDQRNVVSEIGSEEAGDNSVNQGKMVSEIDDKDSSDGLAEETTDPVEQEGGDLERRNQGKIVPETGDNETSDNLGEEATDLVKQEGGVLENNSEIPEGTIRKTCPPDKTNSEYGHVRRTPTAIIVGSNHKFPVRSRYLSSSIGSCHDFCKFGHKHEPETKTMRPMLRSIKEARPLVRTTSDDLAASVLKNETKKKVLFRRLSLPGPVAAKDPPKNVENTNCSKKDLNRSKLKRVQSEIKPSSVPTSGHLRSRSKTDVHAGKKLVVRSSNLVENSSQSVKEIKTGKEPGSHSKSDKEKAKEPMNNSSSPRTPLKKSPSIKATLYKNLKSFPRSKNQASSKEAKINESGDVPEKTLYMIEPNTDKKPARKASKKPPFDKNSPSTPRGSHVRKVKDSKGSQKRVPLGQSSSSTSASMFTASTAQETSQTKGENQRDSVSSDTKQIGPIKPDGGSKTNMPGAKSSREHKTSSKRTGISRPEEEDGPAWKVKFKRGTVVALQVATNAPKKLRFKRKNLGDHQTAKDETARSLRTKEDTSNEPHDTSPETGKVLLRHQEASGKKDNVDLNNVIEETASKLVKTRKSKVKALVGAFETVMSLPDRKPLVETGAS